MAPLGHQAGGVRVAPLGHQGCRVTQKSRSRLHTTVTVAVRLPVSGQNCSGRSFGTTFKANRGITKPSIANPL